MTPRASSFLIRVPSAAWAILFMMCAFTAINPRYLTLDNIVNIVLQNAVLLILALGAGPECAASEASGRYLDEVMNETYAASTLRRRAFRVQESVGDAAPGTQRRASPRAR